MISTKGKMAMKNFSLKHLCRRLTSGIAAALVLAALGITPAHAVLNDGFFELDGNTADSSGASPPDDWDSFPAAQGHTTRITNPDLSSGHYRGIIEDTSPAVFRNGSKDTQDVSAWRYDLGSSPPKDDMLHAYAAAYTASAATSSTSASDLLIYFGADRASFSGTASLGFWFFKNPIARNDATSSFINPNTNAPATHAEGDVLLAFEYTNGGAVTDVHWYKWTGGKLADQGTIGVAATAIAGVFCDPADKLCGSTNSGPLALPWNGTIQAGQFFEGGVNIQKLIPGSDSCFSAFMATSRSSDQPNASIKNFLLSQFPVCHLTVTKACESAEYQAATNTVLNTVRGSILNDGGGPLSNITLVDSPAFDAGTFGFFTCDAGGLPTTTTQSAASLAAGASICYRGKHTSTTLSTLDTVTASASTGSGTTSGTASATCTAPPPPAGLSVTKVCDVDLVAQSGQLALKVNYSGSVTNTGGLALSGVEICEAHEVSYSGTQTPCDVTHTTISIGNLAPGESKNYSSNYSPTQALTAGGASTLADPELAVFKDKVMARGSKPAITGGGIQNSVATEATCPLCLAHP